MSRACAQRAAPAVGTGEVKLVRGASLQYHLKPVLVCGDFYSARRLVADSDHSRRIG